MNQSSNFQLRLELGAVFLVVLICLWNVRPVGSEQTLARAVPLKSNPLPGANKSSLLPLHDGERATAQRLSLSDESVLLTSRSRVRLVDPSGQLVWEFNSPLDNILKSFLVDTSDGKKIMILITEEGVAASFDPKIGQMTGLVKVGQLVLGGLAVRLGSDNTPQLLAIVQEDTNLAVARLINLNTAGIIWQSPPMQVSSFAMEAEMDPSKQNAILVNSDGNALSVQLSSGEINWITPLFSRFSRSAQPGLQDPKPLLAGDAIYLPTAQGTVFRLNREDGAIQWSIDLGAAAVESSELVSEGEKLAVITNEPFAFLTLLNAKSGEVAWRWKFARHAPEMGFVGSQKNLWFVCEPEKLCQLDTKGLAVRGTQPIKAKLWGKSIRGDARPFVLIDREPALVHLEFPHFSADPQPSSRSE